MTPDIRAAGDRALLVTFGGARWNAATLAAARALDAALRERPFDGLVEGVPGLRSLLVVFDPARCRDADVRAAIAEARVRAQPAGDGSLHQIPTCFDGADLAERGGASAVRTLTATDWPVLMIGFAPGFPYLGPVPDALAIPRRDTPRLRVPAGTVAVAGGLAGIYPRATPGGWHLLGRTAFPLFDPAAGARLAAGDRVRFVETAEIPTIGAGAPVHFAGPIEVIEPGPHTTVQDGGRDGWRRHGVAGSGAFDRAALAAANAAVGNGADAPGLECAHGGPELRFHAPTRFGWAGGDAELLLERADLGTWRVPPRTTVLARPGNVLRFGRNAVRTWLAFAGGLVTSRVLGSAATDALGGFGRPLRAGDGLTTGTDIVAPRVIDVVAPSSTVTLRFLWGPQDDAFTPEARARFTAQEFVASDAADRVGVRLDGARLTHAGPSEVDPEGLQPGMVQVPPDGRPIVMGPDAPATGGYPKIATVISADLGALAQVRPGSRLRLLPVEG